MSTVLGYRESALFVFSRYQRLADLGHANGSRDRYKIGKGVKWHGWSKTLPERRKGHVSAVYTKQHTQSTEHSDPDPASALSQTLPGA